MARSPIPTRVWVENQVLSILAARSGLSRREIRGRSLRDLGFARTGLATLAGELNESRKAALPVIAALGGMIVPAGLYFALMHGRPGAAEAVYTAMN